MKQGRIEAICGPGRGRTAMALGLGIKAVAEQKEVIMIQFLKGCVRQEEMTVLSRLEPDLKIFRFEKAETRFEQLSEEEKAEELVNIRNGFHFARKVVATGECDLLILDGVLGLLRQGIVSQEELDGLLDQKDDEMNLILTGEELPEAPARRVDAVWRVAWEETGDGQAAEETDNVQAAEEMGDVQVAVDKACE